MSPHLCGECSSRVFQCLGSEWTERHGPCFHVPSPTLSRLPGRPYAWINLLISLVLSPPPSRLVNHLGLLGMIRYQASYWSYVVFLSTISSYPFLASPLIIEGRLNSRASWLKHGSISTTRKPHRLQNIVGEHARENILKGNIQRPELDKTHHYLIFICVFQFKNYSMVKENSQWKALQFFICNSRAL